MKNNPLNKFIQNLKDEDSIKLTHNERLNLRASLLKDLGIDASKYAEKHAEGAKRIPSPFQTQWQAFFASTRIKIASVAILIFTLATGGMTFAAESSLPGDILYPVKTQVNENVVRVIKSVSPAAKAEFEVRMVDRRLKEAEQVEKRDIEKSVAQKQKTLPENSKKQEENIKAEVIIQAVRAKQALEKQARSESKSRNNTDRKSDTADKPEDFSTNKKASEKNEDRLDRVLEDHKDIIEKWKDDSSNRKTEREDSDSHRGNGGNNGRNGRNHQK